MQTNSRGTYTNSQEHSLCCVWRKWTFVLQQIFSQKTKSDEQKSNLNSQTPPFEITPRQTIFNGATSKKSTVKPSLPRSKAYLSQIKKVNQMKTLPNLISTYRGHSAD
eukprot:TRINITY_DN16324_c0_g1_i1.p1 TRINITY_DN16324_c0_g1~~TRINITY_DN16324_c0_g1_i1.p1  ORF type:complete len:108 (-),score=13.81 TRINITY_DN16324_c0_g1_i1:144-467(-)